MRQMSHSARKSMTTKNISTVSKVGNFEIQHRKIDDERRRRWWRRRSVRLL